MLGKRLLQSLPKTSTLTHNPQIKQLKTAHARSIDRKKNYAPGPRTEKVAMLASASSFAGCASPCATRASSALDQRYAFVVVRCVRRDFCACTKCARSSTHECTRQKDDRDAQSALDQRQTHAGHTRGTRGAHAGHTRGTRGAHAGHTLGIVEQISDTK